jgi:putative serine protease PepD
MSITDEIAVEEDAPTTTPVALPPQPGRLRTGLVGVLVGLLIGGGLVASFVHSRPSTPRSQPAAATQAPVATTPGGGIDVRAVLSRVEPAVVSISASVPVGRFGRGTAAGTGMVITSDGDVLTNAHVVSGATSIRVSVPDKGTHSAHILGMDEANDVAVIKMDDAKDLPTVELGSTKSLQVGDPVVAVGNALALTGSPTVTTGIVSALDREIDTGTSTMRHLIQTDAAINPGNSGGPLLDSGGRVVGMNSAVAGDAQNIGFALSMDEISPKLDALKKGSGGAVASADASSVPYLGVGLQDADQGVGITGVVQGSPAAKAGVQAGVIVVQADGDDVTPSVQLVAAVRSHKPGDKMTLVVVRDGARRSLTATLASQPTS